MIGKAALCSAFIVGFMVFLTVEGAPSPGLSGSRNVTMTPSYRKCFADGNCPEGYFCRTTSGAPICVLCTDCKAIHKRFERYQCAKTFRECGECLPGYKEVVSSVRELKCVLEA